MRDMPRHKKWVIQPTTAILGIMQQVDFKWVILIPAIPGTALNDLICLARFLNANSAPQNSPKLKEGIIQNNAINAYCTVIPNVFAQVLRKACDGTS